MAVLVLLLYIFRPILVVIFSIFLPRSAISAIVRRFRVEPPP
jgi:hypothetical protein